MSDQLGTNYALVGLMATTTTARTATPTAFAIYGSRRHLVEVLFSDDYLMTVSRRADGSYHATGGLAGASVGYASHWDQSDPHCTKAIEIARVHI